MPKRWNLEKQVDENAVCRIATDEDMPQVLKLWQQCFDDNIKFVLWYFARYWKAEQTIGIFSESAKADSEKTSEEKQDELLLASAQVIPYEVKVRDTAMSCGYIVGVDTAPEARHRGYAKYLLKTCLQLQREQTQPISLLMPFEGQFYYRYGWPFCYFHQQIMIEPQELRCAAQAWGNIRKVELFAALPELKRIYHIFTEQYHGTVNRSDLQWKLQLEDAQLEHTVCFLIEDEQQQVQGYFLWTPLKGKCYVREMAWCHARAKAGMLHYLMQNVAEGDLLWLELPEDDALCFQLAAGKKNVVLYPFLMARITDVILCLEQLHYPVQEASLLLKVQDDFAEWNTGIYHMIVQDGCASVNKISDSSLQAELALSIPAVSLSIEALSQLVMGARSAEELWKQELISGSLDTDVSFDDDMVYRKKSLQLLQQLWPKEKNYINEYY